MQIVLSHVVVALRKHAECRMDTATVDVRRGTGETSVTIDVSARTVTDSLDVLLLVSLSFMKGLNIIPYKDI